jgi:hypothetical protein
MRAPKEQGPPAEMMKLTSRGAPGAHTHDSGNGRQLQVGELPGRHAQRAARADAHAHRAAWQRRHGRDGVRARAARRAQRHVSSPQRERREQVRQHHARMQDGQHHRCRHERQMRGFKQLPGVPPHGRRRQRCHRGKRRRCRGAEHSAVAARVRGALRQDGHAALSHHHSRMRDHDCHRSASGSTVECNGALEADA